MVILFVVSLETPAMITILYETIKVLQKKILTAIKDIRQLAMYFHWFHNDTSKKNDLLNDNSNKPSKNGLRFVIFPVK